MTIPLERANAIRNMKTNVERLGCMLQNKKTKKGDYEEMAKAMIRGLRHYPNEFDLKEMARFAPNTIAVEGGG